jgi:hypothetical protein
MRRSVSDDCQVPGCGGTIEATGGEGATGNQPYRAGGECNVCSAFYRKSDPPLGWVLQEDDDTDE